MFIQTLFVTQSSKIINTEKNNKRIYVKSARDTNYTAKDIDAFLHHGVVHEIIKIHSLPTLLHKKILQYFFFLN